MLWWRVGLLVVRRDPREHVADGEQASVWPCRLPSGRPQGHCCVETVIAVVATTPRCPAALRSLPGESPLLAPVSRV